MSRTERKIEFIPTGEIAAARRKKDDSPDVPNGESTEPQYEVVGTGDQIKKATATKIKELPPEEAKRGLIGVEVEVRESSTNTFGFSSKRWNSSWEPVGPKPPWRDLTEDEKTVH